MESLNWFALMSRVKRNWLGVVYLNSTSRRGTGDRCYCVSSLPYVTTRAKKPAIDARSLEQPLQPISIILFSYRNFSILQHVELLKAYADFLLDRGFLFGRVLFLTFRPTLNLP